MKKEKACFPLHPKIAKNIGKAIADFSMIERNDKIMVGLSGGKDSNMLLYSLCRLQTISPVPFEICALTIDPTGGKTDTDRLRDFANRMGVALEVVAHPIFEILEHHPDAPACSMCANLRRGILAGAAGRLGCNVLALGHHKDDVVETVFMNLTYSGRFACFHPHMRMSRSQIRVIRPMVYVAEDEIIKESKKREFPLIDFACKHASSSQRARTKAHIEALSETTRDIGSNVVHALKKCRDAGAWGLCLARPHTREDW